MNDDTEQSKKPSNLFSGWYFWLLIILAALIGKFFGLLGVTIFLGVWGLIEFSLRKKT